MLCWSFKKEICLQTPGFKFEKTAMRMQTSNMKMFPAKNGIISTTMKWGTLSPPYCGLAVGSLGVCMNGKFILNLTHKMGYVVFESWVIVTLELAWGLKGTCKSSELTMPNIMYIICQFCHGIVGCGKRFHLHFMQNIGMESLSAGLLSWITNVTNHTNRF
jgi:hypothetical protein